MELFYTTPDRVQGNRVVLGPEESKHIVRVLRHEVGEQIMVVDGEGNEYRCSIASIGKREVICDIISKTRRTREAITEVTLAPAITKGTKLDLVVEMATELGAGQIQPLKTARTIAGLTPARLKRFEKLAIAALKSSTRTMLPRIRAPLDFEQFVKDSNYYDLKLIAYEEERHARLNEVVTPRPSRVALVIGPEGGFTESEITFAQAQGFRTFTMGPRRMRAETACIVGLSMLLYELKEI
jgi:16S rRNA (uracil1498-N3)-methyltransferase